MKTAIITGADGFMGRHLTKKLIDEGVKVTAIVYPKSPTKEDIYRMNGVNVIEAELDDLVNEKVEAKLGEADAFYHLAWAGVNANDRDNFEIQKINLELSIDAVKLAAKAKTKRFVFPGSTNEYLYCAKPINEDSIPSPSDAYGSLKISTRYLIEAYCKQFGIDFIYAVVAGIYAADRKDNNVIYYTIDKLLSGEKPSLTALEQMWDYVHIDDVVEGLYLIGKMGKNGRFYTIGKGDNQPLYKYIETIRDNIDKSLPLGIGDVPYKRDVLPSSCVDLTAMEEDTGFVPKIEFKDGIIDVINMIKESK